MRDDGEHAAAVLVPGGAQHQAGLQQLGLALPVPLDLRRWGPAAAGAGQVEGLALCGHRVRRGDPGRRGLQQHGQADALGVQRLPRAGLLHHAVEEAIVPVVGRVLDLEVVLPEGWKSLHSE